MSRAISPTEFARVLSVLFDKRVNVIKVAGAMRPHPLHVATFVYDDGKRAAVVACDLCCAGSLGGALSLVPRGEVEAQCKRGTLNAMLVDNLREVMNVLTASLCLVLGAHVRLASIEAMAAGTALPAGTERADYEVAVPGYASGNAVMVVGIK